MKPSKIIYCLWVLLIMAFIVRGMLSDIGLVGRFNNEDIYTFSYFAFAMSAFVFFDNLYQHVDTN